jgi:hypothetical protein
MNPNRFGLSLKWSCIRIILRFTNILDFSSAVSCSEVRLFRFCAFNFSIAKSPQQISMGSISYSELQASSSLCFWPVAEVSSGSNNIYNRNEVALMASQAFHYRVRRLHHVSRYNGTVVFHNFRSLFAVNRQEAWTIATAE